MKVIITSFQDVSESYSFPDQAPSLWWKDLTTELKHYSNYAGQLYDETVDFRKQNIECYFDEGKDTDTYEVHVLSIGSKIVMVEAAILLSLNLVFLKALQCSPTLYLLL